MIGDNIRKLRKEQNISQEALAEKLGVSRQSVSLWENNQTQPSIETILAISKLFNITTDELLGESSSAPTETRMKDEKYSKKSRKPLIIILVAIIVVAIGVGCFYSLKPPANDTPVTSKIFSENTEAIATAESSVVKIFCYNHKGKEVSTGSGVILFHDDMVVTNYHVIEDVFSVNISTDQDITYKVAGVWHANEKQDIAILKLDKSTDLLPLTVGDSSAVMKGETVVAIGSPLGIKNTVSKGNLSGRIMQDNYDVLQFTAPISNGSSGGALFNDKGEVIGITFASFTEGQNLNLAVPIDLVEKLYRSKSIRVEPKSFEDKYWLLHEDEYIEYKYGKTVMPVSFDEIKNNPEKYTDKMISVEAYVSSLERIKEEIIGMYVSSKRAASDDRTDFQIYLNEDYSKHTLVDVSLLGAGGPNYSISQFNPQDKVLITGVFRVNASGKYGISAKQIEKCY